MVIRDSISLAANHHKSENKILSNYYYYFVKLMHFLKNLN